MKLYQIFIKLTIKVNIKNYLLGMMSIVLSIVVLTICNNLLEIMKMGDIALLSSFMYLRFKFSSIQTIISIIGVLFVLNQYHKIMRANMKDYGIMKALGAERNQIRKLIYLQAFLLFAFTVPIGLYVGILFSHFILNTMEELTFYDFNFDILDSSLVIVLIAGMISCAIIVFGIKLETGMKRKLPSQISSEQM